MNAKEVAKLKAISEELKALAKQYNIQISTPSYAINEISQYLKDNNTTMIVAQSNKILDESSWVI